jgi:site-specific recombinase XerD
MVVDSLLNRLSQAQTLEDLDSLLDDKSLSGILNSWLFDCQEKNYSKRTLEHYQKKVSEFLTFVKPKIQYPHEVKDIHVKLFIMTLSRQRKLKLSSVHGYHRAVHTYFAYMVEKKILAVSPMVGMKPPKVPKEIIIPYSQDNLKIMLELCDDTKFLGARNKALLLLYASSGLRRDEMSQIKLSEVNVVSKTIKVMGKGSKERVVGFGNHAKIALMKYAELRKKRVKDECPYLWLSEEGYRLTYWGIGLAIHDLKLRAGLEIHSSTHALRHTFATGMIRNGARLNDVQALMGHTTSDMTQKYATTVTSEDAVKQHPAFDPVDKWRL